jgi:hypothetical protein
MRIKPEHYAYIRDAIRAVAPTINTRPYYVVNKIGRDPERRYRWDLLFTARLSAWVSANVYPYADDSHLDTALRCIVKELKL